MVNSEKKPVSLGQSLAGIKGSLKHISSKLSPHIGFVLIVILLLGITSVVYFVSQSIQSTSMVNSNQQTNGSGFLIKFDQATIEKVRALNDRPVAPTINLPNGRINPFIE